MRNPKPLPLRTKIILNSTSTCMARVTRLLPVLLRFHDLPRFPHGHLPNQADNRGLCLRFPISSRPCLLRSSAPDSSLETIRGLRAQEQGLLPLPLAQGHLLQSAFPLFPVPDSQAVPPVSGFLPQRLPSLRPTLFRPAPSRRCHQLRFPIPILLPLQAQRRIRSLKTSWISALFRHPRHPLIFCLQVLRRISNLPEKDSKIRFFWGIGFVNLPDHPFERDLTQACKIGSFDLVFLLRFGCQLLPLRIFRSLSRFFSRRGPVFGRWSFGNGHLGCAFRSRNRGSFVQKQSLKPFSATDGLAIYFAFPF